MADDDKTEGADRPSQTEDTQKPPSGQGAPSQGEEAPAAQRAGSATKKSAPARKSVPKKKGAPKKKSAPRKTAAPKRSPSAKAPAATSISPPEPKPQPEATKTTASTTPPARASVKLTKTYELLFWVALLIALGLYAYWMESPGQAPASDAGGPESEQDTAITTEQGAGEPASVTVEEVTITVEEGRGESAETPAGTPPPPHAGTVEPTEKPSPVAGSTADEPPPGETEPQGDEGASETSIQAPEPAPALPISQTPEAPAQPEAVTEGKAVTQKQAAQQATGAAPAATEDSSGGTGAESTNADLPAFNPFLQPHRYPRQAPPFAQPRHYGYPQGRPMYPYPPRPYRRAPASAKE